jgi:16S rRNA (adenine1518-N6/adenine1519-N6)-dimethyltransferase
LTSRDPRAVLRDAGLRPKKGFGQNFLVAEGIARSIAQGCVREDEIGRARVVEIGAGTGALTRVLAERARSVVAIERDRDLVPLLTRDMADIRVRIVEGDAQTVDLTELLGDPEPDSPRVLCGNLPYALTGPLLRRTVEHADRLERAVFMVQDEALTVFILAAFDVKRLLRAPPNAFHPPPEVTSAVVELVPIRPPRARETDRFRALVRGAFGARRKTLRNAWSRLAPDAEALKIAAERAGVSLDVRGETLDVEAFARMAESLEAIVSDRR